MSFMFADIILPLAAKGRFTYAVPESLSTLIRPGMRAVVQFGNKKVYTGIVSECHNNPPSVASLRDIAGLPDTEALVTDCQLRLWNWIADYYMCTHGEVMKAAVPSALFPEGIISVPLAEKYRPRTVTYIEPAERFNDHQLNGILDKLARAPGQADLLTAYLEIADYHDGAVNEAVSKAQLLKKSRSSPAILKALVKKGILSEAQRNIGRLEESEQPPEPIKQLSEHQQAAHDSLLRLMKEKETIVLHGVTSSGKTEIYIHLIEEQLKRGRQVLYLLPEIALTGQIITRLSRHFGRLTGVYHSGFNDQERVEIWRRVADDDTEKGYRLIIGVRSSIFLPFRDLGLIIVDEEHDSSYKQQDPAPRYNARDTAVMLAGLTGAGCILGSATPSVESYHNAATGKYGLVRLTERYGKIKLPHIILADTREAYRKKLMVSHFTPQLIGAMDEALTRKEQIMLFQNRRGFSPYVECTECGWKPSCFQCAVNLTWHKSTTRLICHYCGHTDSLPSHCGNCGSTSIATRGFGTEKIEDEVKIIFPDAVVGRMDYDTTRGRNSYTRIIKSFEEGRVDILTGTQMISKGLDFENLTVVGILNADNMLNYPDFRAYERSFQMMSQVSGRAGRRKKQGVVIIQTSDPSNRIIRMLLQHDYATMFSNQAEERKAFNYPPFCRMIKISLKHRDRGLVNMYSEQLGRNLRSYFGKRVLGPEFPVISRIQLWYIKTILLKIEKGRSTAKARQYVADAIATLEKEKGAGGLRVSVDVDP